MSKPPVTESLQKVDILPTTLRGGLVIAGSMFLFNKGLDIPAIRPLLEGYRSLCAKVISLFGGESMQDKGYENNLLTSSLDAGALLGVTMLLGRTPLGKALDGILHNITGVHESATQGKSA